MELILPEVQSYAENLSSSEDPILKELSDYTMANHAHAQMLSGHLQGKFLELISTIISPLRILEIGTFTGYSGICLAKGLKEDGILHTIEIREQDAEVAVKYFNKAGFAKKVILHLGNALEIIPTLEEEWDLVFIDADKVGYIDYFDLCFSRVKRNGLIIADNVLFHGEVLQEEVKGKNAKAIKAFNEYVQKHEGIERVLLTIRDGLLVMRKK